MRTAPPSKSFGSPKLQWAPFADQLGKFKLKDASFDRTQAPHTFKGRLRWDSKLEMDIAGVLDQGFF